MSSAILAFLAAYTLTMSHSSRYEDKGLDKFMETNCFQNDLNEKLVQKTGQVSYELNRKTVKVGQVELTGQTIARALQSLCSWPLDLFSIQSLSTSPLLIAGEAPL